MTCGWRVLARNKTCDILISTEGYEVCTRFCIDAIHHNFNCDFVLLLCVSVIIRSRSFKINLRQGQKLLITFFHSIFAPRLKQIVIYVSKHHYGHLSPVRVAWPFEARSHYLLLVISIDEASFADNNQIWPS